MKKLKFFSSNMLSNFPEGITLKNVFPAQIFSDMPTSLSAGAIHNRLSKSLLRMFFLFPGAHLTSTTQPRRSEEGNLCYLADQLCLRLPLGALHKGCFCCLLISSYYHRHNIRLELEGRRQNNLDKTFWS